MITNVAIDTGDERSVTGHLVSGTVFSAVFGGSINYAKYKKNEITQKELFNDTVKLALQGGIATASAVATANYIGKGNWLGALSAASIGAMGVYTTQKVYDKLEIESTKIKEIEDAK